MCRPHPAARLRGAEKRSPIQEIVAIGVVESTLVDPASAPKQGSEGAPPAWLRLDGWMEEGLRGFRPGDHAWVLTWLHLARRDVLSVHPRDDRNRPMQGVFATRSQDRPNPIGLHRVEILAVEGSAVRVSALEAVDGTPVLDVKPALPAVEPAGPSADTGWA